LSFDTALSRGVSSCQGYNNVMSSLVGERKACAAAVMAFFATIYFLSGLLGPPPFMPMMLGLTAAYLAAFFALVAGYFWARWYSLGVASYGVIIAILIWWQIGLEPIVLIYGGTHLLAGLALYGKVMQPAFDGRKDWRDKYRLDENGANRLGKAIVRAGASLPYLIMAGLAPRQGSSVATVAILGATVATIVGLRAVVRMRTWGILAFAGAALLVVGGEGLSYTSMFTLPNVALPVAGALLIAAAVPFAGPIVRALRD
jgi:hypothetical protein